MPPDASENSQINLSTIGRAARAAGSQPYLPSGFQGRCKLSTLVSESSGECRLRHFSDRAGSTRIEPDRLVVVGNGAVIVAFGIIRVATAREDYGIFRIEPDRLVVVGDGVVIVTSGIIRVATAREGYGIFRIEPDRLGVIRDGMVEVVLGAPGKAANDVGDGTIAHGAIVENASATRNHAVRIDLLGAVGPIFSTRPEGRRREQEGRTRDQSVNRPTHVIPRMCKPGTT